MLIDRILFLSDYFHGHNGPTSVEKKPKTSDVEEAFLKAGQELGFKINDPNAERQIGEENYHNYP